MLTLGLVCAKISAGAGYAILLRRRLGRFWRLMEAGGGCSAPSQPPPTSTTSRPSPTSFSQPLANLRQPLSSEAERYRRECDDKEHQRRPRKPATRRRQRPLRVEDRRVPEATARQD